MIETKKLKELTTKFYKQSKEYLINLKDEIKNLPFNDSYVLLVYVDDKGKSHVTDKFSNNVFFNTFSYFLKSEIKKQKKKETLEAFNHLRDNFPGFDLIKRCYLEGRIFKEEFR